MSETSLNADSRASSAMHSTMSKHCYLKPCDWEPCANLQNVCNNGIGTLKAFPKLYLNQGCSYRVIFLTFIIAEFKSSQAPLDTRFLSTHAGLLSQMLVQELLFREGKTPHATKENVHTAHWQSRRHKEIVNKCHGSFLVFYYTSEQTSITTSYKCY